MVDCAQVAVLSRHSGHRLDRVEIPRAVAALESSLPHSKGPLLGGVATVGAGLTVHSLPLAVLGGVAVAMTFIGPCPTLTPYWRTRRQVQRWQRFVADHDVLNLDSPELTQLADAYDQLIHATTLSGVDLPDEAAGVAHLAVLECTTLLSGRIPAGPAEAKYIAARTVEIRSLTNELTQQHLNRERRKDQRVREERHRLDAIAQARTELEHTTHVSALTAGRDLRARYHYRDFEIHHG
ncbi:hypothetical protein ACQPW1_19550 [Nocardia sp. CA-128927]|uniref:hypothetical protein n=1 Tax=Nocardia sp. CA-128927 TaxID=3239975 RepID=UPI003D975685